MVLWYQGTAVWIQDPPGEWNKGVVVRQNGSTITVAIGSSEMDYEEQSVVRLHHLATVEEVQQQHQKQLLNQDTLASVLESKISGFHGQSILPQAEERKPPPPPARSRNSYKPPVSTTKGGEGPPPPCTVGSPPKPPPPATIGPPPRPAIPNEPSPSQSNTMEGLPPNPVLRQPSPFLPPVGAFPPPAEQFMQSTNLPPGTAQPVIQPAVSVSPRGRGRGRGRGHGVAIDRMSRTKSDYIVRSSKEKPVQPPPVVVAHPVLPFSSPQVPARHGEGKSPFRNTTDLSVLPKSPRTGTNPAEARPDLSLDRDDALLSVVSTKLPKIEFTAEGDELHRQQVMHEFITTEKGYLDDMFTLVEVFLNPIRTKNILSKLEITHIFCNLESLISVNIQFFKTVMSHIDQFAEKRDFPLGQIFKKSLNFFKLYTEYCIKQPIAFVKLDEIQKKNPQFSDFLKHCEGDPRCRGLFLNSFLIKPTQRICKYPLLLDDILKHTPESHEDYSDLSESLAKIKELLDFINERKREGEATSKMLAINDKLEGFSDLLKPSRRLIMDGNLEVSLKKKDKMQELHVFLFNDILLLTRERKNSYEFRRALSLGSISFCNVSEMFLEDSVSWQMKDSKHTITFTSNSHDDMANWMKEIQKHMKKIKREQILNDGK